MQFEVELNVTKRKQDECGVANICDSWYCSECNRLNCFKLDEVGLAEWIRKVERTLEEHGIQL